MATNYECTDYESARALSALLVLANQHFLLLPDEEFVGTVRSNGYRNVLQALADDASLPPSLKEGAQTMDAFIAATEDEEASSLSKRLGIDRTRLYRGVTPSYSPPYPAEAVWHGLDDRRASRLFEDLVALYHANGLKMASTAYERPDYIGVQLEYLTLLAQRMESALEADNAEEAEGCAQAIAEFADNHLDWFSKYAHDQRTQPETDFYRGHMLLVQGLIDALQSGDNHE